MPGGTRHPSGPAPRTRGETSRVASSRVRSTSSSTASAPGGSKPRGPLVPRRFGRMRVTRGAGSSARATASQTEMVSRMNATMLTGIQSRMRPNVRRSHTGSWPWLSNQSRSTSRLLMVKNRSGQQRQRRGSTIPRTAPSTLRRLGSRPGGSWSCILRHRCSRTCLHPWPPTPAVRARSSVAASMAEPARSACSHGSRARRPRRVRPAAPRPGRGPTRGRPGCPGPTRVTPCWVTMTGSDRPATSTARLDRPP